MNIIYVAWVDLYTLHMFGTGEELTKTMHVRERQHKLNAAHINCIHESVSDTKAGFLSGSVRFLLSSDEKPGPEQVTVLHCKSTIYI